MIIFLKHTDLGDIVEITTPSDAPDDTVSMSFNGDQDVIKLLKYDLEKNNIGFYGHILNILEKVTNLDILYVCNSLPKPWDFVSVNPPKIIIDEIPENIQT